MTTLYIVKTQHLENGLYRYRKAMELKDDIVHSKDDFYKLGLYLMEDTESKDDLAV